MYATVVTVIACILIVALVLVVALMRTQAEDALFEHNRDIQRYDALNEKYLELRHFEAAQLINVRELSNKLAALEATAELRKF